MPEVVCLTLSRLVTGELPVDFVVDVRHRDERGHNTAPTTCLHYIAARNKLGTRTNDRMCTHTPGCDGPVVDVASGGDASATISLGENEGSLAIGRVEHGARVDDPVVLGRISVKVGRVRQNARQVWEGVL